MSSSTTNDLPVFPFDVFSQIFKKCDWETLQTCSTLSKDMHECALPFLFQTISFRANRPSLVNIPQEECDNICSGAIQRFTELPKMRVAAFVRRLVYEGCRFPDTDARQHYHRTVWAVFRVTLSPTVYIGLTELILTSVDIDFQDAQGISTLEALRLLYLVNVRLSDGVVLGGRLRPKVLHFSTPGQLVNTSANAILGVCKEVRWLQLHRLPRAPDILYKILEVTPSLTDLHITLERPVNNDQLGAPALESRFCPRLSVYSGPFYYSAIINGRPVWHIDVHEFPESMSYEGPRLWTSQAILEGSSASVMVFKLRKWPAEFCEIFFELVWDHFPHVRELTIELSAYYNTTPDENHADNTSMYNLDIGSVRYYHYLSVLKTIGRGTYRLPSTIHTLSIFGDFHYTRHWSIRDISECVDEFGQNSVDFPNLMSLTVGSTESLRIYRRREPRGAFQDIQIYGNKNINGEGSPSPSILYLEDSENEEI